MQLSYGGYLFPINTVELSGGQEIVYNEGGLPTSYRKTLHVKGFLLTNGQADSAAQETALRTALSIPFQNVSFFTDLGVLTPLSIVNTGSLTGVRVKNLHFPTTQGPEYVSIRSFECDFEAEYQLPKAENMLLSFRETLSFEGGKPIFRHRLAMEGPNQKQLVYPQDTFRATQEGQCSGYRIAFPPPPPLWPLALKESGRFTSATPERKGLLDYQGYQTSWHYQFEDIYPLIGVPHLWPS